MDALELERHPLQKCQQYGMDDGKFSESSSSSSYLMSLSWIYSQHPQEHDFPLQKIYRPFCNVSGQR